MRTIKLHEKGVNKIMTTKLTERDLVVRFKSADEAVDALELKLKTAKENRDKAEAALIELLEANSAVATATYDGLGYAKMMKPRLYASCYKENEESLFKYLTEIGREDMIKEKVSGLDKFVSELVEQGKEVPKFIGYYLKQTMRIYP